jgi:hypothetical protein
MEANPLERQEMAATAGNLLQPREGVVMEANPRKNQAVAMEANRQKNQEVVMAAALVGSPLASRVAVEAAEDHSV